MDRSTEGHDIVIHGWGMLPALLALHLLAKEPGSRVLLLCGDTTVGGDQVEPVVVDRLCTVARDLVTSCCVASWDGYYTVRDGTVALHEEAVWLLDPVQLSFDIAEQDARCTARTGCSIMDADDAAARTIDLAPLTLPQAESEIRGDDLVRQLGLPILADFDSVPAGWHVHQMLPLGDERVLVRRLPLRTSLVTATTSFESLLNALVGE